MMGADYKTKAELKRAIGQPLRYIETSMFGEEYQDTGTLYVVGPDPYRKRSWYARVTMAEGRIVKVQ
jgi:hypothetical protein